MKKNILLVLFFMLLFSLFLLLDYRLEKIVRRKLLEGTLPGYEFVVPSRFLQVNL